MKRPNFFILGAPKCGTTALWEYLRTHPRIFMSYPKEPHFFDLERDPSLRMSKRTYLSLFAGADPARHRAVGEATADYLSSPSAVPGILAFEPKVKFIVMLRDPVEMLPAIHSERVYQGWEDILDFEEAWRADGDRLKGRRLPPFIPNPQKLSYSGQGRLGTQLERLFEAVPKDRVHIQFLEDLTRDPGRSYREVLAFLEVPDDGRNDFPRFNPNKKVRHRWLHRPITYLQNKALRAKTFLGIPSLNLGLLRWLIRLNTQRTGRGPLREDFRAELRDHYREEVIKISELTGRDLSHWLG